MNERAVLTLGSLCALIGGTYADNYPTRWAPPKPTANMCEQLTGTFDDKGEIAGKYNTTSYLSQLIFSRGTINGIAAQTSLGLDADGTLIARAINYGAVVGESRFSQRQGTLTCDPNKAELKVQTSPGVGDPVAGTHSRSLELQRAGDGSLIARSSISYAGMAYMMVPIAAQETYLIRFQPTASNKAAP